MKGVINLAQEGVGMIKVAGQSTRKVDLFLVLHVLFMCSMTVTYTLLWSCIHSFIADLVFVIELWYLIKSTLIFADVLRVRLVGQISPVNPSCLVNTDVCLWNLICQRYTQQNSYSISHPLGAMTTQWLDSESEVIIDNCRQHGDYTAISSLFTMLPAVQNSDYTITFQSPCSHCV